MNDFIATTSSETMDEASFVENQRLAVVVIATRPGKDIAIKEMQEWRKYYWGVGNLPYVVQAGERAMFIYEAAVEQLGFPGEAVTSTSPWPELWGSVEFETKPWRGVFAPMHKHKILFSQILSFRTAALPRLKPRAVITRRVEEIKDE